MSHIRKLNAKHMMDSKGIAPDVTSIVEVDVTAIADWRTSIKEQFISKYGEKITFMPIFVNAMIAWIQQFLLINSALVWDQIIVKKDIDSRLHLDALLLVNCSTLRDLRL